MNQEFWLRNVQLEDIEWDGSVTLRLSTNVINKVKLRSWTRTNIYVGWRKQKMYNEFLLRNVLECGQLEALEGVRITWRLFLGKYDVRMESNWIYWRSCPVASFGAGYPGSCTRELLQLMSLVGYLYLFTWLTSSTSLRVVPLDLSVAAQFRVWLVLPVQTAWLNGLSDLMKSHTKADSFLFIPTLLVKADHSRDRVWSNAFSEATGLIFFSVSPTDLKWQMEIVLRTEVNDF
jgi:hypothetical protein